VTSRQASDHTAPATPADGSPTSTQREETSPNFVAGEPARLRGPPTTIRPLGELTESGEILGVDPMREGPGVR
jgi:hypothetical protein